MSDRSAIQWTDATWNPTTGCTKVSPGCAHCYIEHTPPFRIAGRKFVKGDTPLQFHNGRLAQPFAWRSPRRVFVNSLSDLFHENIPDDFLDQVFAVIALNRRHTFQILTKRATRMQAYVTTADRWGAIARWLRTYADAQTRRDPVPERRYSPSTEAAGQSFGLSWPLANVWLGVTVENQRAYDERIGKLLRTPAAVHFLSAEPLLGPIDLRMGGMSLPDYSDPDPLPPIDWVIVGGESGPGARPCRLEWIRATAQQCRRARVPVFIKQFGSNFTVDYYDREFSERWEYEGRDWPDPINWDCDRDGQPPPGSRVRLPLKHKGGEPADWPEDLRVRDYPRSARP